MAGAQDIRAGRAYVEFATKDKMAAGFAKAQARLRNFGQSCQQLGTTMLGLAAAIAGPIAASLKMFSSLGDAAAKMARRTGLSVRAVQELGFAARLSGTDVGSLEKGIKRMARNIYDAERGLSTSVDALGDLGLSVKDLQGLAPEDQFTLMAEQMSKVEDASRRAALAQVVFGRAGTLLLPMFEQGAAGVATLRKRFRELGVGLTDEEARAAEVFTDAMTDVWTSLKHGVAIIGSAVAPSLKDLTATVIKTVREWAAWVRQNRRLLTEYAKLALKIVAWTVGLGAALIVVGKLAFGVKALIGAVALLMAHPLVAAFVGAAALIGGVCYAVDKLTVKVAKLNETASEHLRTQNEQRAADLARMDRLKELAEKQRLDNREMDEATRIIDELKTRYGDLGVTLDRTTGQLGGVAGAMGDVLKAMRDQAEFNISDTIRELESNYAALQAELEAGQLWLWNRLSGWSARTIAQLNRIWDRIKAAKAAREAVRRGERGALAGGAGAPAAGMPFLAGPGARAGEHLKKLEAEEQARRVKGIQEWKQAEAEKLAEAKRRINEESRLRWASVDEEARLRDEIARAEIEATKEGIEKRLALLKLEYRQRLEQAALAGADLALVKRLYEAQRRLILQGAETEKIARRFEIRGQFGGLAAERLGGGTTQERMAAGIDEIARNTKPLRQARTLAFT